MTYQKWVGNKGESCSVANLRRLRRPLPFATQRGVAEYCHSSLTRMLDLMLRLKYSHIAFAGVDLLSADHFYAVLPEYAHVRRDVSGFDTVVARFARSMYNSSRHATAGRGVHRFIGRIAEENRGQIQMINFSPHSLLADVHGLVNVHPEALNTCVGLPPVQTEWCVSSLTSK